MQNIGADNAGDAFYRYKMPKLVAKIEGRGNGIKTNIVNNVDIARALERPPTYTLKHFGCELGAQTNFDKNTGISIVNGAHDAKKLSEVLEIFIKKYVQCYGCGNPETVVKVKREAIHLKCKACGFTSNVDMRDKLTTFILKNPPEVKVSKSEAKVKREEKERMKAAEKEAKKAEKEEAKKAKKKKEKAASSDGKSSRGEENSAPDDTAEEDAEAGAAGGDLRTDISAEAVAARQRQQLTSAAAALIQGAMDEEGSGEQAAANKSQETPEVVVEEEDEEGEEEDEEEEEELPPAEMLARRLQAGTEPIVFADLVLNLEVEGGVVGRIKAFYAALMHGCTDRPKDVLTKYDRYVHALAQDEKSKAAQLMALEYYLTQVKREYMADMPFILKWLYEEDLIDDDIIVNWGDESSVAVARKLGVDAASAKQIRKLCQQVLEWLDQDDEDEEDDEDDEE